MIAFSSREWLEDLFAGFTAYYLTSLPVLLGLLFGLHILRPLVSDASIPSTNPITACIRFDATEYLEIILRGYSYDPDHGSRIAFFPVYPLLGRWVSEATGLSAVVSALLVSHTALFGAFVLLARYVRVRWPEAKSDQRGLILALFGLWPLGLFFRMPYSESLFVFGTLVVLYGMTLGWPLTVLALLTGLVTGMRPVGVALTAVFVWHVLTRPELRPREKTLQVLLLAPLACWGLLAFMGYQRLAFGTPFAFVQTQDHWAFLAPENRSWRVKLWSLATLEPIWGVYIPGYCRYWGNIEPANAPLFNLTFWNPILFVMSGTLLLLGGLKRWLTSRELVLGASLLAIPYLTRSFEMSMASHGRFAAVVVVNYLVIGRFLNRLPAEAVAAVCGGLALFLCLFTSLYVADYLVF